MQIVLIALFGMLGVLSRYGLHLLAVGRFGTPFPVATFAINLVGSFAIGFIFVVAAERELMTPDMRVALTVGFLGGFTTFSAYSLEVIRLVEDGEALLALLYFAMSPIGGAGSALLGLTLARTVFKA